jgi:imidazolonepropionase-like amidohydrolase
MGTSDAARAVGLDGAVGALRRGRFADFALYEGLGARARKPLLEALVRGAGRVGAVRVGGRSIRLSPD